MVVTGKNLRNGCGGLNLKVEEERIYLSCPIERGNCSLLLGRELTEPVTISLKKSFSQILGAEEMGSKNSAKCVINVEIGFSKKHANYTSV